MLNEKKLTKSELDKREDIIMKMKKNKRSLVQKYGKDAEQVMYGRATNMAKKQAESMNNDRLKEMIKDALKNPSKADLNKDGKLSDYEETRGAAIEKSMDEVADLNLNTTRDEEGGVEISNPDADEAGILDTEAGLGLEEDRKAKEYIQSIEDEDEREEERKRMFGDDIEEDLDLGHEDNEPGMLKAELYHIGSYAMDLYKMMDALEGQGEVDFPAWWQSKITTAKNMISGAKHYLEFELKEPTIDAMVDRMDDIAPEMEVDVDDVEIEEGLPKGFWDKKMDAKDEVKETLDDSAWDMADSIYDAIGGIEFKKAIVKAMSTDDAKLYLSAIMRDYALNERIDYNEASNLRSIKSELEDEIAQLYRDMEQEAEPEGGEVADRYGNALDKLEDRLAKVQKQLRDYDMNESYNTLVNKIKKSGKSEKAAKAIAGAVASYKAKGGGKGPTAKQKG